MIQQLTAELINKIAAGEVVERPSSVVKELVENSIDANSSEIIIEIKEDLIRVKDNGDGIIKEDLEKLFINHSTSKIKNIEDLSQIFTMGFRGEAIATIASVSKMTIRSKSKTSHLGYAINTQSPIVADALNTGTVVEVNNLFFNVPARKKFLKSIPQENRYIIDIIRRISLSFPHISFKLIINDKLIFNLISTNLEQRIKNLIPNINLIPIIDDETISGFISIPKDSYSKAVDQYMYVNNRFITPTPSLSKAVFLGYKNALMRGQYPPYVLFINIDPKDVDVNVHPRKLEVRFENEGYIFQKIYTVIQHTLFKQDNSIFTPDDSNNIQESSENIPHQSSESPSSFKYNENSIKPNFAIQDKSESSKYSAHSNNQNSNIFGKTYSIDSAMKFTSEILFNKNPLDEINMNSCSQYMNSYIVTENIEGLVIFDQHACSERFLFEKYKDKYNSKSILIRKLLIPEIIPDEFEEFIMDKKDVLKSFGIEIDTQDKKTYIIGIPEFSSLKIIDKVYAEIRNIFDNEITSIEDLRDKFITTLACHSAIRFGDPLNKEECKKIIQDLNMCNNKLTCPHGRPTYYVLSKDKLIQIFKR